jgi:hypothetical protein
MRRPLPPQRPSRTLARAAYDGAAQRRRADASTTATSILPVGQVDDDPQVPATAGRLRRPPRGYTKGGS